MNDQGAAMQLGQARTTLHTENQGITPSYLAAGTAGYPCNGNVHFNVWSEIRADGWTYQHCPSCGRKWRTKTITEEL